MKTTVKERQTVLDIGLRLGGRLEAGIEIAIRNGLSASGELSEGDELEVEVATGGMESGIVRRMEVEGVEPATEVSGEERVACPWEGIGWMGVEVDFVLR